MNLKIACISGDGIGPEIINEAKKVLVAVLDKFGHGIEFTEVLLGGACIDATGKPITDETIRLAKEADAVLMGSIGGDTNTSPW